MAEAIVNLGLILRFLTSPSFIEDLSWITKAMQGETGGVMGENKEIAAKLVARVIFNRLDSHEFPDDSADVVFDGFRGHVHGGDSDPDMRLAAFEAFVEHLFDVHFEAMYMFSYHDCADLGYSKDEAIICLDGIPGFGLCFFEEQPGGVKQ